jgi:hypothetical protein
VQLSRLQPFNPQAGANPGSFMGVTMKIEEIATIEAMLCASVAHFLLEEIVALVAIARENKLEHLAYLLDMAALSASEAEFANVAVVAANTTR